MEMTIEKLDLAKTLPQYYKAKSQPEIVDVQESKFLSLSGMGAPEGQLFESSIETIYPVAYAIKKYYKGKDKDFVVPKLECYWWVESEIPFDETPRNEWFWELVIRMPEYVDVKVVEGAITDVIQMKSLSLANEVYLKKMNEGLSVQALHMGSYDEEGPTINKMFEFIESQNLEINGRHHEVYISDPRKTPVERLKTILRYAVKSK